VTARQHRHPGSRVHGALQHPVGERPASVAGDDDIAGRELDLVDRALDEVNTPRQVRPALNKSAVDPAAGNRQHGVNHESAG